MQDAPEGWTDDLSITLPSSVTINDVVDVVLRSESDRVPLERIVAELVSSGLSEEDAHVAHDRALGGLMRGATRSAGNAPSREKDPVAWASYQRCSREPDLVKTIRSRQSAVSTDAATAHRSAWWQF